MANRKLYLLSLLPCLVILAVKMFALFGDIPGAIC